MFFGFKIKTFTKYRKIIINGIFNKIITSTPENTDTDLTHEHLHFFSQSGIFCQFYFIHEKSVTMNKN